MKLIYTWVEAHEAIAAKLLNYRNNQQGLVDILNQCGVDKLNDEEIKDIKTPLTELDPFTFFSYIYKHGALKNKKILKEVCRLMNIGIDVKDICGVPTTNAQNVWYFQYKWERVNNEIERMWNFFEKLLSNKLDDNDFEDVLNIKQVGKSKLLDGMFRIKPFDYLCLNGQVIPYLAKRQINANFKNFTELKSVLNEVRKILGEDFPKLSYDSYLENNYTQKPRYFRIGSTAGLDGDSVLGEMVANNVASIGWSEIGDLEQIIPLTKAAIKDALNQEGYYNNSPATETRKAGEIMTFYNEIKPFDYVLVADGMSIKAIGKIISDNYFFESSFKFSHCRNVSWVKTNISDLNINEGLMTSVWQYQYPKSIQQIEEYLEIKKVATPPTILSDFPLNIILYGPPGTGKTYNTIDKAVEIIKGTPVNHMQSKEDFDELRSSKRISFVTFHQNYTYEDFMIGIKPNIENSNQLSFEKHEGIFYKIVQEARTAYDNAEEKKKADRFVLIIDEINRANISRVFGELITLLEDDKRVDGENELSVTLSNGENFCVPPNLYLVGTMNTADKSIALIDIALRRRFEFIGMYPDYSVLNENGKSDRIPFLEAINKKIYEKRKSADYLIGHAYLLIEDPLEKIINNKIIPLLMEYFGGRNDDVISIFEGSGYDIKYDTSNYKWLVEQKAFSDDASQNI